MSFRPEQRLRRGGDIQKVRGEGRRLEAGAFVLWYLRRPEDSGEIRRVAVIASRAAVGGAVRRNRAKRRLRELFRRNQEMLPPGVDVVLSARSALPRLPFVELERRFAQVCEKIRAHHV